MASVDFKKVRSVSEGRALVRHCDRQMRLEGNHGNKEIDKSLTPLNGQLKGRDYEKTIKVWRDRIRELDANGNTNHRKDRVELFALCIPCPVGADTDKFWRYVSDLCMQKFGKENLIQSYCHHDETHEYTYKGQQYTSRTHIHLFVVPEVDGSLNGKEFSSRKNMVMLNREIDLMCKQRFHVPFLKYDTTLRAGAEYEFAQATNVEELKRASKDAELALEINTSTKNMIDTVYDANTARQIFDAVKEFIDPDVLFLEEERKKKERAARKETRDESQSRFSTKRHSKEEEMEQ